MKAQINSTWWNPDKDVLNPRNIEPDLDNLRADLFIDVSKEATMHLKTITATYYYSTDSTFTNKSYTGKIVIHFNKDGNITCMVKSDNNHKTYDSTLVTFDKEGHEQKEIRYDTCLNLHRMLLIKEEYFFRNADNTQIIDSERNNLYSRHYNHDTSFSTYISHITCDKKGNEIKRVMFNEKGDTIYITSDKYDLNNNHIYSMYRSIRYHEYIYHEYDARNNELVNIHYMGYGSDTEKTFCTYDSKNRLVTKLWYRYSCLFDKENYHYSQTGEYTLNKVEHQPLLNNGQGNYNIYTDENYDSNGNKLMTLVTADNRPDSSITTHKLQFNSSGKVICDSEITIGFKKVKSLKVHLFNYDANGNTIYEQHIGGDRFEYMDPNTTTYTTYNDKNLIIEQDFYYTRIKEHPMSFHKFTFYADGTTVKTEVSRIYYTTCSYKYGTETQILEKISEKGKQVILNYEKY